MSCPDADGQIIEIDADITATDLVIRQIDAIDGSQDDLDVWLAAENSPDGIGDVGGR